MKAISPEDDITTPQHRYQIENEKLTRLVELAVLRLGQVQLSAKFLSNKHNNIKRLTGLLNSYIKKIF
jgi:hypothetical protein